MHERIEACAAEHGFEHIQTENVAEINGRAHMMRHASSGARLLFLENDDVNKAFSITFKTPAADDTGVFHILEHSVLCGSKKYPVKEPFVNLLKSSMQTFLNAMTFPDKTMYPVASTNEQDLMNLADVYMDAVFQPLIYKKRAIFEQEGWHYEFASNDASDTEGEADLADDASPKLIYNGVVFNEMKGALSDPDSVLYDALSAALFPDTTYRFEAGGTPASIPDLTYEKFLNTHARHYRPDNSYIVLYGDLDIDKFLGFLDDEYLSPLAKALEGSPLDINPMEMQSPVVATGVRTTMSTAPENSCAAMGFVVGSIEDRERLVAADILLDAIMGSNVAPLKRAILDADIADDAFSYLGDGMMQPFAMIELKGLRNQAAERFPELLRKEIGRLCNGALDHELIEAALSHAEFVLREHNLGYADGVVYAISAMTGWLYSDEGALSYIRYEDVFESLREKLSEGYFEQLLRELFLENNHYADVELVPVNTDEEAEEQERLDLIAANMTEAQIEAIEKDVEDLRNAQNAPDSPEDVAKLPFLSVKEIGEAPSIPLCHFEKGIAPCIRHEVNTNGIAYFYRYFDLSCVSFEELSYASVLAMVLGKLDTETSTAAEIDLAVQSKLGNLSFFCEVHESRSEKCTPRFVVSASVLSENSSFAATIADEVILSTDFRDFGKLNDVLVQRRVAMEQNFTNAGHSVAAKRAASYYMPAAVIREQLSGIDFYRFLCDLLDNFEERREALADKLAEIARRVFTDDNCVLSFAGSDEDLKQFRNAGAQLGIRSSKPKPELVVPEPKKANEAFIVPTDVTYTGLGANRKSLEGDAAIYSGSWLVAARALSFDYLWHEVRVIGGAYGSGFQTTRTGSTRFYSYRDPHIDETVKRMEKAGEWLSEFDPDEKEFGGYIVSTAAGFDAPLKPRDLIRRQDGMYFGGYTPEDRLKIRQQVVETTLEEVRSLGSAVTILAEANNICVVGNRDIIEQSELPLKIVELV